MTEFTNDQKAAMQLFEQFVSGPMRCMILKGYAGTGKTFLIGHMARFLTDRKLGVALLAPTGRAARVMTEKTGIPAHTIHRYIYNLDELKEHDDEHSRFKFFFQLKTSAQDETRTVIIVDESSMVSDNESEGEFIRFGSGKLLTDLFEYARMQDPTQHTKILFIGDDAQLPPVGMNCSPALDTEYLKASFNVKPTTCELTQVVRQRANSKILEAATTIRENIRTNRFNQLIISESKPEIIATEQGDIAKRWKEAYKHQLPPPFVCITYSNDAALRYNLLTRAALWGGTGDESVRPGDFLIIIANNRLTGLLNGDIAIVLAVEAEPVTKKPRIFVDGVETHIELKFRSIEIGYEVPERGKTRQRICILENVLYSDRRDISPEEQKALYVDFKMRHSHLKPNTKAFTEAIVEDEYFNALRVKFGYAGTCHKAQGGEWPAAVVVFEFQRTDKDAQRWAYTAITRAKNQLFGVNLPSKSPWDGIFNNPTPAPFEVEILNNNAIASPDTASSTISPVEHPLPATAPDFLKKRHANAIAAWSSNGIVIKESNPRIANHHIKYRLSKDTREVQLTLYFNNREQFNLQVQPVNDPDEVLTLLARQLFDGIQSDIEFPSDKPVLKEFYENQVLPRIASTGFKVVSVRHNPYVERYTFFNELKGTAIVDFHFDGKGVITNKTQISGQDPFQAG